MTVRLNVLLIQSPRMSALQSDLSAELAVQLMGIPGIDLSIASSLDPGQIGNTDRLMIESLQHDLVVVDWRPVQASQRALHQLGIGGSRAPHPLDSEPPAPTAGRRFYLVDLRAGHTATAVAEALHQLLENRRIVTVPLAFPAPAAPAASADAAASPPQAELRQGVTPPAGGQPVDEGTEPAPAPSGQATCQPDTVSGVTPRSSEPGQRQADRGPSERDLDAWVDGVNDERW